MDKIRDSKLKSGVKHRQTQLRLAPRQIQPLLSHKGTFELIIFSALAFTALKLLGFFLFPASRTWIISLSYDLLNLLFVFILPLLVMHLLEPNYLRQVKISWATSADLLIAPISAVTAALFSSGVNVLCLALLNQSSLKFIISFNQNPSHNLYGFIKLYPGLGLLLAIIQIILPSIVISIYCQIFYFKNLAVFFRSYRLMTLASSLLLALLFAKPQYLIPYFTLAICLSSITRQKQNNLTSATIFSFFFLLSLKLVIPALTSLQDLLPETFVRIKTFSTALSPLLITLISASIFIAAWLTQASLIQTKPTRSRVSTRLAPHQLRQWLYFLLFGLIIWTGILNYL